HDRRAHEPSADPAQRLGRQRRHVPRREREPYPLVVGGERERREDLPAEPARPDAVARIAGAVVDAGARLGAEERQVVGGDVDRAAPGALDTGAVEPGEQAAEPRLGALRSRPVAAEAVVDPAAEAD